MGGCENLKNNSVILANVEISINKNFLENAENIFEKTKSSTFNLYNNGGFHAISALGKNNDLPIAINNQTSSKIYVFKDIKNKIGINKAYSANSHPLFFVDSNQLKRYKVGVSRYGAPTISLLNANKKEIFKYKCNNAN